MKLKPLVLTTALLVASPAFAQQAPVCTTSPDQAAVAERLCLDYIAGTNIGDQRNCFDAIQAFNAIAACVHDAFVFLMDNPNAVPPSTSKGPSGE